MRAIGFVMAATCFAPCVSGCGSSDNPPPGLHAGDAGADASVGDGLAPSDGATLPETPSPDSAGSDGGAGDAGDASAQPSGFLRVANWAPDAPGVDVCVAPHATAAFTGPVVGAIGLADEAGAAGLTFPSASAYFALPPAQYDLRVVVAGGMSCTAGIAPDFTTLPALGSNTFMTIALVGEVVPSGGDPALGIVGFIDDYLSSASVALRFINASPALSQVDVGTGTLASGKFKPLFLGVPFAHASTQQEVPMVPDAAAPAVDLHGYENVTLSGATLSVHASGTNMDAVVTTGLSAAAGSVLTIVLVNGTSAENPPTPKLLECVDNAGTAGALGSCRLLP